MQVNGGEHEVETHDRAALMWALRDELGCTSVKYGCSAGRCGSCRVTIDGVPDFSCQVTVGDASGRDIRTLEGYLAAGEADRVVDALLALDAGQCGYCLPGMTVTLTALARRGTTSPTRSEVVRALDDHLCRCGSHTRILTAAFAALGAVDG